jgi:hypothetical protein
MTRHAAARPRYFAIRGAVVHDTAKNSQLDGLIRELAERSVAPTRRRLRTECDRLDAAELRGYVRARGASLVRSQVQRLVVDGHLPSACADDVAERVVERTVHLVLRDIKKLPVVSVPLPLTLQRAA